jgi:4-carboxymuconolactone decarboxylase
MPTGRPRRCPPVSTRWSSSRWGRRGARSTSCTPDFRNDQEATAHAFTRQLLGEHRVGADTYARAEQAFGSKGLVDMVLLIGLYSSACALINAFEVPVPR